MIIDRCGDISVETEVHELQQIRGMTETDRDSRMQSESFRKRFDATEQGLIRDTVANLPPE